MPAFLILSDIHHTNATNIVVDEYGTTHAYGIIRANTLFGALRLAHKEREDMRNQGLCGHSHDCCGCKSYRWDKIIEWDDVYKYLIYKYTISYNY